MLQNLNFFVTILCLLVRNSVEFETFTIIEKRDLNNYVFGNNTLSISNAKSPTDCGISCWDEEYCFNFLYNSDLNMCYLYDKYINNISAAIFQIGWSHFVAENACTMHEGYVYSKALVFCYKYYPAMDRDYSQTFEVCKNDGGYLVKIDNDQKQNEIYNYLQSFSDGNVRIQGRRQRLVWEFDDGTTLPFFNWNTPEGQPEGRSGEDYIALKYSSKGAWHDIHSHAIYSFVCEIPM